MKVVCEHCGLPFGVARVAPGRAVYCCSGCALAARVTAGADGRGPVNPALVTALGLGFGFFNQVLFWMLAILLARQNEAAGALHAGRFALASLAIGAALWLAMGILQLRAGARRAVDGCFLVIGCAGLGWAWASARPGLAVAVNLGLAAWSFRGLARGKTSGKK